MPASGIRYGFPVMKFSLILLLALGFVPINPLWADAGVSQRIQSLTLQVEQSPKNPLLLLRRGLAYMEDNQPELALADIRLAESLGDPVEAAYTHGVLLYRQGDYAAARPYFDRYLQTYPQHWGALGYRARLLRDIGENRQALADYETLISLNNALDPGYYVATARLMASVPERGVDEALALLDKRIAQRGPITSLQRYAIDMEQKRGNYMAAIERMALLDEKLRATPQWQLEVAQLLLLAGRGEEALAYVAVAQEQLQSGRMTAVNRQLMATAQRLKALAAAQQTDGLPLEPRS
jgi:tetratricopeptide (TPR) repeat protein